MEQALDNYHTGGHMQHIWSRKTLLHVGSSFSSQKHLNLGCCDMKK